MKKEVDVKSHTRKGKVVQSHKRSIKGEGSSQRESSKTVGKNIVSLAQENFLVIGTTLKGFDSNIHSLDDIDFSKIKDIQDCSFRGVNMKNIDFSNINIKDSDFENVAFDNVTFNLAHIQNVSFFGARFFHSQFNNSTMRECNFGSSRFTYRTSFNHVQIEECQFSYASFEGQLVDSKGAHYDWRSLDLWGSSFYGAVFECFQMQSSKIVDCSFLESEFTAVGLDEVEFNKCLFLKGEMEGVSFDRCNILNSKLETPIQSNVNYVETVMKDSSFESDFVECSFDEVEFLNVSLKNSNFKNTSYPWRTFDETVEELGVTQKAFEFMVLSGAVEVRSNETSEIVNGGFNPTMHHIPLWSIDRIKTSLQEDNKKN